MVFTTSSGSSGVNYIDSIQQRWLFTYLTEGGNLEKVETSTQKQVRELDGLLLQLLLPDGAWKIGTNSSHDFGSVVE